MQLAAKHHGRRDFKAAHVLQAADQQIGNIVRGIEYGLCERKRLAFERLQPFFMAVQIKVAFVRLVHDDLSALLQMAQERAECAAVVQRLRGIQAGVGLKFLAEREDFLAVRQAQTAEKLRLCILRPLYGRTARGDEPVGRREQLVAERTHLAHISACAEYDLNAALLGAAHCLCISG